MHFKFSILQEVSIVLQRDGLTTDRHHSCIWNTTSCWCIMVEVLLLVARSICWEENNGQKSNNSSLAKNPLGMIKQNVGFGRQRQSIQIN